MKPYRIAHTTRAYNAPSGFYPEGIVERGSIVLRTTVVGWDIYGDKWILHWAGARPVWLLAWSNVGISFLNEHEEL